MHHLIQIWSEWVLTGGYLGIIVLMAMGSTPIPLPAEVVVPPAAFLAAQGRLSLAGVILASTLGAYLGAALMYWLSLWLGRPLVVRFGRFILFPPKKLEEAEHWLARYEAGGVFFARLLPGVRHLISIPAGIVRMNFMIFSTVTVIGSAISCSILAYLGVRAQHVAPDLLKDPQALIQMAASGHSCLRRALHPFDVAFQAEISLTLRSKNWPNRHYCRRRSLIEQRHPSCCQMDTKQ